MNTQSLFTTPLLKWFDEHGRKNLPWQHPRTAYTTWLAEIMLQQTQVKTVIFYYERFLNTFPDLASLTQADEEQVLALWAGLGYYSRARNLLKAARIIQEQFQGVFPNHLAQLSSLPGIGESTAAAILSQAFNLPTAILDANVKRVLSRYFMIAGQPGCSATLKKLWETAKICMCQQRCADYTQAIMDLGALCCTHKNPNCPACPLNQSCQAYRENKVAFYPTKKAKKNIPLKEEQFFLLSHQGKIFLEKRPPVGIWGGLWCFPNQSSSGKLTLLAQKQGFIILKQSPLKKILHTFSHFKLLMHALVVEVDLVDAIKEPVGQWFTTHEALQLGIAAPIKQLIKCFGQENNSWE